MPTAKDHFVGLRVDEEMREALQLIAKREQISVGAVVRHAITEHVRAAAQAAEEGRAHA